MKEIVFNKKDCPSYKDFYEKICIELESKKIPDWEDYDNLHYNADFLNEFMWYNHDLDLHFKFIGYNKEKVNFQWQLIFEVVEDFCKKYPNKKVEFWDEE